LASEDIGFQQGEREGEGHHLHNERDFTQRGKTNFSTREKGRKGNPFNVLRGEGPLRERGGGKGKVMISSASTEGANLSSVRGRRSL